MLDDLLDLLLSLHGTEIESLHDRSSSRKLWRVIRWRRKLLDNLAANTSRRLFPPHYRAVSKVALDEKDHLLVPNEDFIAADDIQPPLDRCLQPRLILLSAGACRGCSWRDCGYNSLRASGDQVFAKLDEFAVYSADVAELGGPELGQIGLRCGQLYRTILLLPARTYTSNRIIGSFLPLRSSPVTFAWNL